MKSYKLLSKFKFGDDGRTRLTSDQVDAEYKKRLQGYGTTVTNMYPHLDDKENLRNGRLLNKSLTKTDYPIFWITTPEMMSLTYQIGLLSKKIVTLRNSSRVPNVAIQSYLRSLLTNEIFFTNEIEGVHTNPEEISTIVWDVDSEKRSKNRRLESTIRKYQTALKGEQRQITELTDLRKVYDQLLKGEITPDELPDGKLFRDSFVYIGNKESAVHLPPDNESEIDKSLNELIMFMNNDEIIPLVKAIVTHFMFENIHPFRDGNGRTGRYLLSSYLSKKIDNFTGLTISTAIHTHVQKYYRLFKEAGNLENRADVTEFIVGMMEIIVDGQQEVIDQLQQRLNELETNFKKIKQQFPNLGKKKLSLLYVLLQSKLFTNGSQNGIQDRELRNIAKKMTNISRREFSELMQSLENEDKLLKTVSRRPLQHVLVDKYLV